MATNLPDFMTIQNKYLILMVYVKTSVGAYLTILILSGILAHDIPWPLQDQTLTKGGREILTHLHSLFLSIMDIFHVMKLQ